MGIFRASFVLKLGSIELVLLLMRLIKESRLHPRLAFITETLGEAMGQLIPFGVLFSCFMYSFSYAGIFLFGQDIPDFVSFAPAVLKLWNMLLGDFDSGMFMNGFNIDIFKVVWFVLFFILVFYILLNMLLAIVMDAYSAVGENAAASADTPPLSADYLALLHWAVRRFTCCSNADFYGEMANQIDVQCLENIQDAYTNVTEAEMMLKYVRRRDDSDFRSKKDELRVSRLLDSLKQAADVKANGADKEECPERQLLEVRRQNIIRPFLFVLTPRSQVRERVAELALRKICHEHLQSTPQEEHVGKQIDRSGRRTDRAAILIDCNILTYGFAGGGKSSARSVSRWGTSGRGSALTRMPATSLDSTTRAYFRASRQTSSTRSRASSAVLSTCESCCRARRRRILPSACRGSCDSLPRQRMAM